MVPARTNIANGKEIRRWCDRCGTLLLGNKCSRCGSEGREFEINSPGDIRPCMGDSIGILEGQEVRPQLLARLGLVQELYPSLELNLERNSFAHLRNGLKAGHYDLIVTLDFDVEQEPEFDSRIIFPQAPAIAINRKHPLANQEMLDMAQLADEDFVVISPEESPVGYDRFIKQCQETGFTPRVVRQPRSLESLILCVEMGVGVALLDQYTRLTNSNVRTFHIPGKDMFVVAAFLKDDCRPVLQNVVSLLSEKQVSSAGQSE